MGVSRIHSSASSSALSRSPIPIPSDRRHRTRAREVHLQARKAGKGQRAPQRKKRGGGGSLIVNALALLFFCFFFFHPLMLLLFRRGIRTTKRGAGCFPSTRLQSTGCFHEFERKDRSRTEAKQGTDRLRVFLVEKFVDFHSAGARKLRAERALRRWKEKGKLQDGAASGSLCRLKSLFLCGDRRGTIDCNRAREEQGNRSSQGPAGRGGLRSD